MKRKKKAVRARKPARKPVRKPVRLRNTPPPPPLGAVATSMPGDVLSAYVKGLGGVSSQFSTAMPAEWQPPDPKDVKIKTLEAEVRLLTARLDRSQEQFFMLLNIADELRRRTE